jgi:hypothetical protein
MTQAQLRDVMKYQLTAFNTQGVTISDDTLHDEVLIDPEAQKLYKGNILWTIHNESKKKKTFPSGWLSLSVTELAKRLVIILIIILSSLISPAQVKLNMSAVKTDLKSNALSFAFSYVRSLDSTYGGQDYMLYGKRSWFMVTPDIDFQAGNNDALSSITGKAVGLFVKFRTTTVSGIVTPDVNKVMHVFPVSLGVETSDKFNFINGLFEAGYVPFYQSVTSSYPDWMKHTKVGVYLQAGYKFKLDSTITPAVGGKEDESEEQVESAIFRAKGFFDINSGAIINLSGLKIGLVGKSALWYDFLHAKVYYRVDGIGRIYLNPLIFFDLQYTKGSGAPLFNTGDQFSTGLTITF